MLHIVLNYILISSAGTSLKQLFWFNQDNIYFFYLVTVPFSFLPQGCVCTPIHLYTHIHMHIYTFIHIHIYMCIYVCTYTYTYIYLSLFVRQIHREKARHRMIRSSFHWITPSKFTRAVRSSKTRRLKLLHCHSDE